LISAFILFYDDVLAASTCLILILKINYIAELAPLLRAIAECFSHLSHGLSVCLSVRPSVRHTAVLCQSSAS